MVNKFKEIKQVEDKIKEKIEQERKKGEEKVASIEREKGSLIDKMREEIKQKRHDLIQAAEVDATKEADKIIGEADSEIKKYTADQKLVNEAAKIVAQTILNVE